MMEFWDRMSERDPGLAEKAIGLRDYVFQEGALSQGTKELIYVGICCAMRLPVAIRVHVERALEHGATRVQIYEAVALSVVAAGIPAYREAVTLLQDVLWPSEGKTVR
jgi:alkylhydroperoxidase/carboxymuconolactone decarboxylase family protein YurZ